MTQRKERLTVTVDPDLVEAAQRAVREGRAESLSGWVNAALGDRATRDRRLETLAQVVADYEAEFGQISAEEMESLQRADREAAVVVRGERSGASRSGRRGKGAA